MKSATSVHLSSICGAIALAALATLACELATPGPTGQGVTSTPAGGPAPGSPGATTSGGCPAPGSPTLGQPSDLADYPAAIQQYLSAGGDLAALENALASWNALPDDSGQVVSGDLTGDGIPEVVVAFQGLAPEAVSGTGDILILACRDGAYDIVYHWSGGPSGPSVRLIQVVDANSDGRLDVAHVLTSCGAHTCFETLEILGWDGASFVSLMGGVLDMPFPTYTVAPGRIEARSGMIGSVGAEPQRAYSEVWEWNGSAFTVTQRIWAPPIYRYHALLDGDRALREGNHAVAIAAYRRVVEDETLQGWEGPVLGPADERAQLAAFARWRLLLAYALMGDQAQAQAAYDGLVADYPAGAVGHDMAALADRFWAAYQAGQVSDGCRAVVATAAEDTAVLDFFNGQYGYANPLWEPADLCPFVE